VSAAAARRHPALLLAATLVATGACKVNLTPEGVAKIVSGVIEATKDLTPENEYYVGRSVATTILARHDYKYRDEAGFRAGQLRGVTAYVNNVGAAVAFAALDIHHDDDRASPIGGWHFVILENETINAFAAPGGFVFVTRKALENAATEDELAAILAHEVAHVRRGHALGSIKKSRWAGVAKEALDTTVQLDAAALGNLTQVFEGAMADMTDALIVKGYSRDTELEADRVGLEIMVRAGYDPRAFVAYLRKLEAHQDTGRGGFYATHPKAGERIAKLDERIAKLEAVAEVSPVRTKRFKKAMKGLAD
jgi:beta-barrel assembly-enhancing protease